MRILIVDDDAIFLEATRRLLAKSGHVVTTAGSAAAGLDALRASDVDGNPFRVVLSDWEMPGMTGPAFCRAVRAEFGRDLYFILVTGLGEAARFDGLHAGADDFLSKPVEVSELQGSLRAAEMILTPKPAELRRAV